MVRSNPFMDCTNMQRIKALHSHDYHKILSGYKLFFLCVFSAPLRAFFCLFSAMGSILCAPRALQYAISRVTQ